MNKNKTEKTCGQISFEAALEKLEALVIKMEEGKLPLEEAMTYFEEGNKLAEICSQKLKEIERKIEILVTKDSATPQWKELNPDNTNTKTKYTNENLNDDNNTEENLL
jgi:exodeoxyribonuclease VII small subunit